jgi:hypothetical protein
MTIKADVEFVRQAIPTYEYIGMVIPPDAKMLPDIEQAISERIPGFKPSPPTEPPTGFTFHYNEAPFDRSLLQDGAVTNNGIYEFEVRDAVLGVFDLPAFQDDEFSWSFSSTSQIAVIAAVKIGETIDVEFHTPFDRVFHVTKYHFPPGISHSGYGKYSIHLTSDALTRNGFRIVSSYEPNSPITDSRLPFFFGFRVYGRFRDDPEFPIWRELLAQAVRHILVGQWHSGLLSSAFAVESFVDSLVSSRLVACGLPDRYVSYLLRLGDRAEKLNLLNDSGIGFPKRRVNRVIERLNQLVFAPRNQLAHGKTVGSEVSAEKALLAIKEVVTFMWDWSVGTRHWLLPRMKPIRFEDLVDDELLRSCGVDVLPAA